MSTIQNIIGQQTVMDCVKYVHEVVECWMCDNDIGGWSDVVSPNCDIYDSDEYSYEIRTGATKVVLIPHDQPYVIKIPYAADEWDGEIPNYCDMEAGFYDEAEVDGCEQFFVPTQFLTYIKDIPVYIQTKIYGIKTSYPTCEEVYEYASIEGSDVLDADIGGKLVKYYSSEEIEIFLAFIVAHNINDLEADRNGSYVPTIGRYMFWDYSGYHENIW